MANFLSKILSNFHAQFNAISAYAWLSFDMGYINTKSVAALRGLQSGHCTITFNLSTPWFLHWPNFGFANRSLYEGLWKVGENGRPEIAETLPIEVFYPPESKLGIWGGEGYIRGRRHARSGNEVS